MGDKEQIFNIAGNTFDKIGLESFCLEKISVLGTPSWERDIWNFILEWLSSEETISVQTSGSTGKPKKIQISKKYMVASAKATIEYLDIKRGDLAVLCLPIKFIAGKMMVIRALVGGLDLYFSEPSALPDLGNFKEISFAAMVAFQLSGLLETENGRHQLNKIEKLLVGGSFLPGRMKKELHSLKTQIWQTYGMTETITHIALRKVNGKQTSDWYKLIRGVEVEKDNRGCLVIHAPHIGVENLVTNDLVEINNNGAFQILGRIDHVITSGGIKIHPEMIEQKLQGIVENEFFIAGIPDDKLGEKLTMLVEDDGVLKRKIFQLWKSIEERVSGYEIPKEIIFLSKFTRTENGKINRNDTMKLF